jgi:hypothetical protein
MLDILGMGVEDTDTFILILFINFPDPHTLISAAGGQEVARWGPSH